jgi:ABC-type transport system substrate-binding protein
MIAILAAVMVVVALACGGEAATPTSAPTATKPAPTATVPSGPTATAPADATSTPVPEATVPPDRRTDYVNYLLNHPGYKEKWGVPQYGGTIRAAGPSKPNSFQITQGWSAFMNGAFAQYNSLLMMDPWLELDQKIGCDLCESFEVSADGLTYTFKLRKGVKFQSEGWGKDKGAPAESYGAEMTCEDIKASHEWSANPPADVSPSSAATLRALHGHLDSVTCPDGPQGYTAVLNYKYFRNATLGWLTSGPPILNKEYREWMDKAYPGIQSTANAEGYLINMGTGPWIPTFADSQTVLKNKRNPNYFIKGAPFGDAYEDYPITEYNTKFASLATGKIHHVGHGSSGLTKAQVIQVQRDYPNIELHVVRYNHISHFELNPMRPPFDNWKVRWAVNLALDRKSWDEFMTAGAVKMSGPTYYFHSDVAKAGWGVPVEEYLTYPGYRQDKKDEDIAEANRLLDEVFGPGVRPRSDQYIIQLLSRREISIWGLGFFKEKLNWEFDVKYVDTYGKISDDCLYTIRAEASQTRTQNLALDPSDGLFKIHSKTGNPLCTRSGWKGTGVAPKEELDRIDALIDDIDTNRDQARRHQLVRELELYLMNERVTGPGLGVMNSVWANRGELRGSHFFNVGTYSQFRLTERWWLAK